MNDFFSMAAFANRYTSNRAQFGKACDADLMVRYPANVNFVMYSQIDGVRLLLASIKTFKLPKTH